MQFIPEISVLLSFTLACVVLFVTPGPDMSLFLSRTIAGGKWAGFASMAGASAGCAVHTFAAALGLSAIIAASTTAFTLLKIVGAAYLAWLAFDAIRRGSALSVRSDLAVEVDLTKTFLLGIVVNLTNPKVVLFFITFLPQFVDVNDPFATEKFLFLGAYFIGITAPLAVIMILGAERVVDTLKRRPMVMRTIDYCFAGIFGAFAIKILATQGK